VRALFLGYVLGVILWQVLQEDSVTWDTIAGAACVYVLVALLWGDFYQLVERMFPDSFVIPDGWQLGPSRDPAAALIYFSFGTLTTSSYGDVRPNNLAAGGLCMAEALVGQLYLAIMIARLVGIRVAQRTG
jgi:hypothetical protein